MVSKIKTQIEQCVNTDRFNMKRLESVWSEIEEISELLYIIPALRMKLDKNYHKLVCSILRNVFLIELVEKPKIETTKFRYRWFDGLNGDPRECSFDECIEIAKNLLIQLVIWIENPINAEVLRLSFTFGLVPYEAPIDYIARSTKTGRLHELGNIAWVCDDLIYRTLKLREYLKGNIADPDAKFLWSVLKDKIEVKTYRTDRVLTGVYKTNREKRWETHPSSVHFAERRTCMAIEYNLVTQVCEFDGFPAKTIETLQSVDILPRNLPVALCPITGDHLSYESFKSELLSRSHGKSNFQVGHLNPLKSETPSVDSKEMLKEFGHSENNISWITADGNRIQGSLSLKEVRLLLERIAINYAKNGW